MQMHLSGINNKFIEIKQYTYTVRDKFTNRHWYMNGIG